jgi:plastocyanin
MVLGALAAACSDLDQPAGAPNNALAASKSSAQAAGGASVSPTRLVVGVGDPAVDVPAVQEAVDAGGDVLLRGTFSFDQPPIDKRSVRISHAVRITGAADDHGGRATIVGGWRPFDVDAPGAGVSIEGIRFVHPEPFAIDVHGVRGLRVEDCLVDHPSPRNVPPFGVIAGGLNLFITDRTKVTGEISILDNEFDIGGVATVRTYAMVVIGVGTTADPADVLIAGNRISNVTGHGVDLRQVIGQATIEGNVIHTGAIGGQEVALSDVLVDGIRILGGGSYVVRGNTIEVGFENAAGIRLQGNNAQSPLSGAHIEHNDITMALASGAVPGSQSAGIELRRIALDNAVSQNRIRGRANAAISLLSDPAGGGAFLTPGNNAFVGNNISTFTSTLADVLVGPRVMATSFTGGSGIVDDHGVGTTMKGGYRTLTGAHYHVPPGREESGIFTSLTVSPASATLFTRGPGITVQLVATPLDQTGQPMTGLGAPSFSTSNGAVATVNAAGLVTAAGPGVATVTATLTAEGVTSTAAAGIAVQVAAATADVTAPALQFTPGVVDVSAGGQVTWTLSSVTHNVTFTDPTAPPSIAAFANGSQSRTFPNSGTFIYQCTLHPGMSGTVRVH